jgi:hypothetical protein
MGRARPLRLPLAVILWPAGVQTGLLVRVVERPHLVCTVGGLPVGSALTGAKADERQTVLGILAPTPRWSATGPGQTLIGDKDFCKDFGHTLPQLVSTCCGPAHKGEWSRRELIFPTIPPEHRASREAFKSQRDLDRHVGHSAAGVLVGVQQRIPAATATIRHHDKFGATCLRNLAA